MNYSQRLIVVATCIQLFDPQVEEQKEVQEQLQKSCQDRQTLIAGQQGSPRTFSEPRTGGFLMDPRFLEMFTENQRLKSVVVSLLFHQELFATVKAVVCVCVKC